MQQQIFPFVSFQLNYLLACADNVPPDVNDNIPFLTFGNSPTQPATN